MRVLILGITVFTAASSLAAPREFPLAWTTQTAAQGQHSLETWLTPRLLRSDDYARVDTRLVWTYGVARTLESQLSMDIDVESQGNQLSFEPKVTSLWRWTTWRERGSPVSFGGLARLTGGASIFEVEGRLLMDARLGQLLITLNAGASRAAFWDDRGGANTRLDGNVAFKYAFSSHAAFGFESRARSSWAGRAYMGTAFLVGPVLTIQQSKFWVTMGGFTQVAAHVAKDKNATQELEDNERFVLHLSFGLIE